MKKEKENINILELYKRLFRYIKPYKFWFFLSIAATIVSTVCDLISIYMINQMVDNSLNHKYGALKVIIIEVVIMLIAGFFSKYYSIYASGKLGTYTLRDMRVSMTEHIERLKVCDVEKGHTGDMLSRMSNDLTSLEGFIMGDYSYLLYLPLIMLSTAGYLALINWKLFLISYIPLPIILYFSSLLVKRTRKYAYEYYKTCGEVNSIVQDTIGGIGILKAFNLELPLHERAKTALGKAFKQGMKRATLNLIAIPSSYMTYQVPSIICIAFGGVWVINGHISPGSFIAFVQLLRMLVNPTTRVPYLISNVNNAIGTSQRIFEVLDQTIERDNGETIENKDINKPGLPVIEFEDVDFSYNESQDILTGLSFKIMQGSMTSLIGHSGCGKSTIINLICGFYEINKGRIKLYGKDLNHWNIKSIRSILAVVSQDTYLFPDTIEENIRYGRPDATEEEIVEAAKAAYAHEFIMESPEGYKTLIGERGVKLSGGQRQRVSIARAILKNAPILLMDEPTSALDTQSEAIVQQALEDFTKNRTVLVIAHRLSTIKQADSLLVVNNGTIAENGTHEELMELNGLYKQLYDRQLSVQE